MQNQLPAKLHVLTLTPFFPFAGGEVNGCFVAEPLRQLKAFSVSSSVMAIESIYHAPRRSSAEFPAEWVRYPRLPYNFGLSSAGRFLGAALLRKVRQLHRRSPIHLIHAHAALPCGSAAALLSRHLGIPFVVTIHGLDVFNSCFQHGISAGWRRKASLKVYESARKIICVSDKVRRLLTEVTGGEVATEVVYNGTDSELFAPGPDLEQTPTILAVGNLSVGKGQDLVLKALARLKDSYPDLRCRIIGDGADRDRFATLAGRLEISDRVQFCGWQSRSEVADAMSNCTVFVLPSRYEALGCVYLEAMACAKPAIACHGQGIDEIIHHGRNGWLISVDSLEELEEALRTLLGSPELRAKIGQAARQTIVSGLTLSHQAEHLLRIYQEAAR
jgi:teichuronic acid biosynthesis glycosyltransferase TuaC